MVKYKTIKWNDHIALGLYAFAGFGMEIFLIFLESILVGKSVSEFGVLGNIVHWLLTCSMWGTVAFLLIKLSKKNNSFDVFIYKDKPSEKQLNFSLILLMITTLISFVAWRGFKPFIEFNRNGTIKFIFQYIYYIFEALLIVLTITFGQRAGEMLFKNKMIPWGGFFLSITWGLMHILMQDLTTGIFAVIVSILYGIEYILLNKNIRYAYPLIFLMFIL